MNVRRISLKLGNMRKAQDFIVYPKSRDEGSKILIQSDKRIAQIDTETGEGRLSTGKGGHQGFMMLNDMFNPIHIKVGEDIINEITGAQPKSGDTMGGGIVRIA